MDTTQVRPPFAHPHRVNFPLPFTTLVPHPNEDCYNLLFCSLLGRGYSLRVELYFWVLSPGNVMIYT